MKDYGFYNEDGEEKGPGGAAEHAARNDRLYTMEASIIGGPMSEIFLKRNPVVSRTVHIRGDQTLEQLHGAIFAAFDRFDPHMYEFRIGGKGPMDPEAKRYVLSMAEEDPLSDMKPDRDVARTTVGSLGLTVDQAFGYWFDFGDDWWHQIDVIAIEEKSTKGKYPKVIKRVGESPPQYLDWDEEDDHASMDGKIVRLPNISNPTIEHVLDEFIAEQRKRLKPRTMANYEDIASLLKSCFNGYAYQGLSEAETALFDRHYEAEGAEHREFCQIFGHEREGFSGSRCQASLKAGL